MEIYQLSEQTPVAGSAGTTIDVGIGNTLPPVPSVPTAVPSIPGASAVELCASVTATTQIVIDLTILPQETFSFYILDTRLQYAPNTTFKAAFYDGANWTTGPDVTLINGFTFVVTSSTTKSVVFAPLNWATMNPGIPHVFCLYN